MSKKDHNVKNQLKGEAHNKPSTGGAHPTDQNDLAQTPVDPSKAGQGHQRQPRP
ncbi:hypothetical protein [Indioceanicola profundi]|uniref:hypothetical protein n=1 Tax=Indioceanicola profundi TaxID=2220096 RepID=UPI0013C5390A|nr:hypothetical protein [Indioceanicola profundi]